MSSPSDKFSSDCFDPGPKALGTINLALHQKTLKTKSDLEQLRAKRGYHSFESYPYRKLEAAISEVLAKAGLPPEISLVLVDRSKFDADLSFTIRSLLQSPGGSSVYIKETVPKILELIKGSVLCTSGKFEKVEAKGLYINIKLSDKFLFTTLDSVFELKSNFGQNDTARGQSIVVDYSSPNAAKKLHAGHIRSTILGEILCNLYEASGATAHRLNHINDLGGFGFLLEGFTRWESLLPKTELQNDRLAELYQIYRTLEKLSELKTEPDTWPLPDRELAAKCLGPFRSRAEFMQLYVKYVDASNLRYANLENGEPAEVELWQRMVAWSLEDFKTFYELLGIQHDYVIGESFYYATGLKLLEMAKQTGQAVKFSPELAERERDWVESQFEKQEIKEQERASLSEAIKRDLDALVISMKNHSRLVVLRSDGRTIYATRDLGAIAYRKFFFEPSRVVYVVGQEQSQHFEHVFEAADQLGLKAKTDLCHLPLGFYIDAASKKKLSSRDGASNVNRLLVQTIAHFEKKLTAGGVIPAEEARKTSRQLGVGSIIINDVKKSYKSNVEVQADLEKAIDDFEKSGGAYIVYSACRAKSILRKYSGKIPQPNSVDFTKLSQAEAEILKRILEFPARVKRSAQTDDPSHLVSGLLDLCQLYNGYYNAERVIDGETVHMHRLVITAALAQVVENGLRLCHIECPDRI